jgi:putative transposase
MIAQAESVSINRIIRLLTLSKGTLYHKRPLSLGCRCRTRQPISPAAIAAIEAICERKSTFGAPRVRAILRRDYGHVLSYYRVRRIMRELGLLIHRSNSLQSRRPHTGVIAVERSNVRWASDITSIVPWNRDKGRFTYVLDCCDRSIIAWRFERHIQACDIEQMVQEALITRFGGEIPDGRGVEFFHDNGPEYLEKTLQGTLTSWNVKDCHTPTYSPQSNGMCEAFNGTFKRDYVYDNCLDDFETVKEQIGKWVEEYNTFAPHSALGMLTPHEFFKIKLAA